MSSSINTKPYFRKDGRYKDGRERIVIEQQTGNTKKKKALPKPEQLLLMLGGFNKA